MTLFLFLTDSSIESGDEHYLYSTPPPQSRKILILSTLLCHPISVAGRSQRTAKRPPHNPCTPMLYSRCRRAPVQKAGALGILSAVTIPGRPRSAIAIKDDHEHALELSRHYLALTGLLEGAGLPGAAAL